jgi:hypothetical protein
MLLFYALSQAGRAVSAAYIHDRPSDRADMGSELAIRQATSARR